MVVFLSAVATASGKADNPCRQSCRRHSGLWRQCSATIDRASERSVEQCPEAAFLAEWFRAAGFRSGVECLEEQFLAVEFRLVAASEPKSAGNLSRRFFRLRSGLWHPRFSTIGRALEQSMEPFQEVGSQVEWFRVAVFRSAELANQRVVAL